MHHHQAARHLISIHALREEGDEEPVEVPDISKIFLSTPSARRATRHQALCDVSRRISIHALREEGDMTVEVDDPDIFEFLSTPSARRATLRSPGPIYGKDDFYPRPPRGGRQAHSVRHLDRLEISIHALREEGDAVPGRHGAQVEGISIHALREEGDFMRYSAHASW